MRPIIELGEIYSAGVPNLINKINIESRRHRPRGESYDEVGMLTRLYEEFMEAWRKGLDHLVVTTPDGIAHESDPDTLYARARTLARAGNLNAAADVFTRVAELDPALGDALEAQGEILDMEGRTELAIARYAAVRKLRARARNGTPDRTFVLRQRRRHTGEIAAYTSVLHSVRRHTLPYVARGNAYLAEGRPLEAIADYESALRFKPDLNDVKALKGEALSMMGQYQKAIEAFDAALAAGASDAEVLSGRAIAHIALGRLEDADADWRRQLEILPSERSSARACVALRLADYETATLELEYALRKEPTDLYWQLYFLAAHCRLRKSLPSINAASLMLWPAPLIAMQLGQSSREDVLVQADNNGRRAEALFQLGILALARDSKDARRHFEEVIGIATPSMIEYAAARHELARLPP